MKIHLIATGGSIMHNMAIALHKKGYVVTGSDDQIYEPASSRLAALGLLPEPGWDASRISEDIDIIILGMHAKPGNPELDKAVEMSLPIMSFPQFIYEQSKEKKRIVVAGSHGKTSVTAMIMHVLQKAGLDFDYAVGSTIAGFEDSVKLSDAPLIVIEGDEYLSSALDRRPKFMWYKPQVAHINGIAWDHINVFPTYNMYLHQFADLMESMEAGTKLSWHAGDNETARLAEKHAAHLQTTEINIPDHTLEGDKTIIYYKGSAYTVSVFGRHNLQNLAAACSLCEEAGVDPEKFWTLVSDFKGAGKRLERIANTGEMIAFRDFAHAPSKVTASVEAVAMQYPARKLIAILELHTFSSLNKEFIVQYAHSLDKATEAIVYLDNQALKAKGGDTYTEEQLREAFQRDDITLAENADSLKKWIGQRIAPGNILLLMSSGNFGGLDILEMVQSGV